MVSRLMRALLAPIRGTLPPELGLKIHPCGSLASQREPKGALMTAASGSSKPMRLRTDTKQTKTIGEHHVASELARRGWAPALTRDGLERTDILAVLTEGLSRRLDCLSGG
jgi:hypothetical protein